MKPEMTLSDKKVQKLAKRLSKSFSIPHDEALALVYEEWDYVETLFAQYGKVKSVHQQLVEEINYIYRIA